MLVYIYEQGLLDTIRSLQFALLRLSVITTPVAPRSTCLMWRAINVFISNTSSDPLPPLALYVEAPDYGITVQLTVQSTQEELCRLGRMI